MLDRIQGSAPTQYAMLYENKGTSYTMLGMYDEAMSLFEKCLAINQEIYGENSSYYATTLCDIASACKSKGEYDKAFRSLLPPNVNCTGRKTRI